MQMESRTYVSILQAQGRKTKERQEHQPVDSLKKDTEGV
jgi:hypothetical protein